MNTRALGIVSAAAAVSSAVFAYWQASVASRAQQSTVQALKLAEVGMVFPHKLAACLQFSESMFHLVDALNELEQYARTALAQGNPSRDHLAEIRDRYRAAILNYSLATLNFQIANGARESFILPDVHSSTRANSGVSDQSLEEELKRDLLLVLDEVRTLRTDTISMLNDVSQICSRIVSQPALAAE